MKRPLLIVLTFCFFICASCMAAKGTLVDDNKLLSLLLHEHYQDGGYTVVSPQTGFSHLNFDDPKEVERIKKHLIEGFKIEGVDIVKLVDLLLKRNKAPVTLTLKSSPKDGYLIDYDKKFEKYFEKDGGGWEKWYKENPKARGWTLVSLPAHDPESNILLVYRGIQSHWLEGSGWVVAYKYENGKLKELSRVMMWIS